MLDEASSYLTMFNTKTGRYRFTVMPFGIMVAGDIFQQKLDECIGHIKNLIVIGDDIIVIGKHYNHKDHDLAFTTLLQTARRCNIKLNYDKLRFKCTEVNFMAKLIQLMGTSQHKTRSQLLSRCLPPAPERGTVLHQND